MSRVELLRDKCPHCGKVVTVTWHGVLRVHGPPNARCPGSGMDTRIPASEEVTE